LESDASTDVVLVKAYHDRITSPTTLTIDGSSVGRDGTASASWCPTGPGSCSFVDSGTLVIQRVAPDGSLDGRYSFRLASGTLLESTFHATWSDKSVRCR